MAELCSSDDSLSVVCHSEPLRATKMAKSLCFAVFYPLVDHIILTIYCVLNEILSLDIVFLFFISPTDCATVLTASL